MKIHIEDLRLECIIGILDFEREKPQKVLVNFKCKYKYQNEFLDYAQIVSLIKNDLIESRYFTLEEAIESIGKRVKKKFTLIEKMSLKISKPEIINGCIVGVSRVF